MNVHQAIPLLPATGERAQTKQQGFTITFILTDHQTKANPGDIIFSHEYMKLSVGAGGNDTSLKLNFSYFDGYGSNFMSGTNSMCTGLLVSSHPRSHYITIVADGGANIISYIIDGIYCDESWSWIPQTGMSVVPSSQMFQVNSESELYGGVVDQLEVYDVALRTSEIVAMSRKTLNEER